MEIVMPMIKNSWKPIWKLEKNKKTEKNSLDSPKAPINGYNPMIGAFIFILWEKQEKG
ncbi:hypothetical protein GCM10027284_43180 [Cyclobacterium sediminis]